MASELIRIKYPALTWHTASHWQAPHGCFWCRCGRETQRLRKLVQCVTTRWHQHTAGRPEAALGDTVGSALPAQASLSQLATSGQGLCGQRWPVH